MDEIERTSHDDGRRAPRPRSPRPSGRRGLALLLAAWGLASLVACRGETGEPERWRCSNPVEVQCRGGDCSVAEGDDFTPLEVRFDAAGALSVCAYSGCWEGDGQVQADAELVVVTGRQLAFSTSEETGRAREDVALVLERSDRVGVLKVADFAVPIVCTADPS